MEVLRLGVEVHLSLGDLADHAALLDAGDEHQPVLVEDLGPFLDHLVGGQRLDEERTAGVLAGSLRRGQEVLEALLAGIRVVDAEVGGAFWRDGDLDEAVGGFPAGDGTPAEFFGGS